MPLQRDVFNSRATSRLIWVYVATQTLALVLAYKWQYLGFNFFFFYARIISFRFPKVEASPVCSGPILWAVIMLIWIYQMATYVIYKVWLQVNRCLFGPSMRSNLIWVPCIRFNNLVKYIGVGISFQRRPHWQVFTKSQNGSKLS